MILQAVIGNANHLDYGVVTIPFPIPMKEEDIEAKKAALCAEEMAKGVF